MSANDASSSWWRRQRLRQVGAVLLGAWALYAPYRDAWQRYARSHPLVAIDVAHGAQVPYRGARWRFLNLTERDVPKLDQDAMALVARFELMLDEGVDPKSLGLCDARLTDARYRGGIDSFLSNLVAQRSLYSARRDEAAVQLAALLNRVELYRSLGADAELAVGASNAPQPPGS